MERSERPPRYENELLLHSDRVQSLARSLTQDSSLADDLAQDTMVQALAHPAVDHPELGAWLARVVRNRLYQEFRANQRRRRRESVAWDRFLPDDDSLTDELNRSQVADIVRDAVLSLDEPYRSTVLLRYFSDLTPGEIAGRQGVPEKTVKTRLYRGQKRLREKLGTKLDTQHQTWGLVALFGWDEGVSLAGNSAIFVKGAWWLVATTFVSIVATTVWWLVSPVDSAPAAPRVARGNVEVVAPSIDVVSKPDRVGRAVDTTMALPAPPAAADRTATLHGIVLDASGRPVTDAQIRYAEFDFELNLGQSFLVTAETLRAMTIDGPSSRSGDRGVFEIGGVIPPPEGALRRSTGRFPLVEFEFDQVRTTQGVLYAERAGMTPIFVGLVSEATADIDHRLVLAEAGIHTGMVLDDHRAPLDLAGLVWEPPDLLRERIGAPLGNSFPVTVMSRTDVDGRFVIDPVPLVEGGVIRVSHSRQLTGIAPVPLAPHAEINVTTYMEEGSGFSISGRVVNRQGRPVFWAAITDGATALPVDEDGSFHYEYYRPSGVESLTVIARGYLPVRLPFPTDVVTTDVDVELWEAPLTIRGEVFDAEGLPMAGVRVGVETLTPLWDGLVETPVCVEHVLETRGFDAWVGSISDESGCFEIVGLDQRDYNLCVMREGDGAFVRLPAIPAGSDAVTLRFPPKRDVAPLTGVLVDSNGSPLTGVEVRALRAITTLPRPGDERGPLVISSSAGTTTTDHDGRYSFAIDDLTGLRFATKPRGYFPIEWTPAEEERGRSSVRELDRIAEFRIDASSVAAPPRSFRLLDLSDRLIEVEVRQGAWVVPLTTVPVESGFSQVASVPERARWLELIYDDRVVRRSISLRPGELLSYSP